MTTLILLLLLVAGVVPVIYTIRVLSIVPLTVLEAGWMENGITGELYRFVGVRERYFKGGKWWKRGSWSNVPNGEPGATIPDDLTKVFIIGDKDCDIDHSPFKKWMHRYFWFEDVPPVKCIDFHINTSATVTIHNTIYGTGMVTFYSGTVQVEPGIIEIKE